MTKNRIKHTIARLFAALAYIFVTFQWLWVLALGMPPLIETGLFDSFTYMQPAEPVRPDPVEPSPVLAVIAGVITLIFIALTIIILIRLPRVVSRTGDRMIQATTEAVLPVITHHQKIPVKKKRELSRRISAILQMALILLPLLISFFIPSVDGLTSQIIIVLAATLAALSSICFIASWVIRPTTTSRIRSRASHG